jgi:hypothetical protein
LYYGEKIERLASKVEEMELHNKNNGHRRGGGDDDEYDRPNSSDLLQPEQYSNDSDEENYYYGDVSMRSKHRNRGGGPARSNGGAGRRCGVAGGASR